MLTLPAVVVMLLVAGFPILYAFWLSLHRADLRFPNLTAWIGLDNYISVLSSHTWWSDFLNTVIITVFSVALEIVLGLLIAEAMYRALYARTWIRVAVLVPYGAVTVVSAFAWSLAFNPATGFATQWLGLSTPPLTTRAGSFAVIILSDVWKTTPFISLLMLGALALVPEDLYKAAKVDGATAWQRFWRITLPADQAGAGGRGAVPGARRLPDLRLGVHHHQRIQQHRERVAAGLPGPDRTAGSRAGLGDRRVDLLLRLHHRLLRSSGSSVPVLSGGKTTWSSENTPSRKTLWGLAVIAVLVYALFPVVWIISLSLKTPESIGDGSFLPTHWTLSNYSAVFNTDFFPPALRNSIGIALITTCWRCASRRRPPTRSPGSTSRARR